MFTFYVILLHMSTATV